MGTAEQLEILEARIADLEQSRRRFQKLFVGALGLVLVVVCQSGLRRHLSSIAMGAPGDDQPREIRAQSIELTAPGGGKVRLDAHGIEMQNSAGRTTLQLISGPRAGQVIVRNGGVKTQDRDEPASAGEKLVVLGSRAVDSGGAVDIYNPFGSQVATLRSGRDNYGMLFLYNENGNAERVFSYKK